MKRKEETVVVEEVLEEVPATSKEEEKIEKEEIENTDLQVVDNKIVDKDGFAVSDDSLDPGLLVCAVGFPVLPGHHCCKIAGGRRFAHPGTDRLCGIQGKGKI